VFSLKGPNGGGGGGRPAARPQYRIVSRRLMISPSINQSTNQQTNQAIQSASQSPKQSISDSLGRPIDLPTNRPIHRHTRSTQFGLPIARRATHSARRPGSGGSPRPAESRARWFHNETMRKVDASISRWLNGSPSRCADRSMPHPIDQFPVPLSSFQPPAGLPPRRPARLSRLARVARPAAGARLDRARRDAEKSCSGPWPFLKLIFVTDWGSTSS
jgi:hypothetical protein